MTDRYSFPDSFLWGTASSAHQTEGNNKNSDWWNWEITKKKDQEYPLESSGISCDFYNRYEEDFNLASKLNNNAIRISIEWARIQPKEKSFSRKEFDHYRKVLKAARKRKLKTFVTLHHFTNPLWFSKKGGWRNLKAPYYFCRYARKCAEELGDYIDAFVTINEPQVYALMSYTNGTWPPNKVSPILSFLVQVNMIRAHKLTYKAIKKVNPNYSTGIVKNIVWYESYTHIFRFVDKIAARILFLLNCEFFILPIKKQLDFIGVNYYFTSRIKHLRIKNPNVNLSDLGWWIHPHGLEKILLKLKKFKLPIYVTENGIADSKDEKRKKFIEAMLISCAKSIKKGVALKGYFYWSLIDNYEWHHGFWPRFGLIEIDRENGLKRIPRKSFYYYAKICKENLLPP